MSILVDLLEKLESAADKVDAARDRITGIAQSESVVASARAEMESLKDNAPGMKESRITIRSALAARVGKGAANTPTIDMSQESIVGRI